MIRRIRSISPDIPVIICTGYSKVVQQQKIASLGIGEIIMKPIELGYIANSIRRLLEKKN